MHLGLLSQKGILVKSSEILENAYKIKTIAFDKTGTLTQGNLNISKIINYSSFTNEEIITILGSIEVKSEHPIAKSIVRYAKEKGLELLEVNEFRAIGGQGIYAKINRDEYYAGNRLLLEKNNIKVINSDEDFLTSEGNSIVYLAKNKQIIALIGVKDIAKKGIGQTIEKLKNCKIDIIMLTGDNEKTAKHIANEIGINKVLANCKPKEKSKHILKLKETGITAFVGDGINDSVSLVSADIGISISGGTDIAKDSADVVFMNNNLDKILDLINISKKTIKNIKQNLFWAFFYNIIMIPIAMGIFKKFNILLNPMIASFSMTISSLTVVFNALRLKRI